jgi:hypothetical protein
MTQARGLRRGRRASSINGIPQDLQDWFAGEPRPAGKSSIPWSALIVPDWALLPERWEAWREQHPDASPPEGFEWLDDPTSKAQPRPEYIVEARKMMARRRS